MRDPRRLDKDLCPITRGGGISNQNPTPRDKFQTEIPFSEQKNQTFSFNNKARWTQNFLRYAGLASSYRAGRGICTPLSEAPYQKLELFCSYIFQTNRIINNPRQIYDFKIFFSRTFLIEIKQTFSKPSRKHFKKLRNLCYKTVKISYKRNTCVAY